MFARLDIVIKGKDEVDTGSKKNELPAEMQSNGRKASARD
jgi:hypothetical protein